MKEQLIGKVALITGAASGIGRETALAFAQEGAKVVLADLDKKGGQAVKTEIEVLDGQAIFVATDVSQDTAVSHLINETVDKYGRLDYAINNAGIESPPVRMADITETDFDRLMAVNVKGVWLCMKYELQQMLSQGRGVIVNMASAAGLVGAHSLSVYAASKHAVVGLTKSAAIEYAHKNIRVNAVCPSVINTPMVERVFEAMPKIADGIVRNNPSRRLGQPHEVAAAVLWLCSDAASFVNGVTLSVDGGFVAQ